MSITKIYTAGVVRSFPGHGGGHDEQMICRVGSYGGGDFPPFFFSREAAQSYIEGQHSYPRLEVVECDLVDTARASA